MSAAGFSATIYLTVGILAPLALLLVFAHLFADQRELPWRGRAARWRLRGPTARHFLWGSAIFTVSISGYFLLGGTSGWIADNTIFRPPAEFEKISTDTTFWGVALQGNWWVLVLHFGILVLNVSAEEIWFRGELFPRQEAAYGRHAWLVHGLSYHLFHMFYPWDVIRILPESLMYGIVAQKTGSTWPGIIGHMMFNSLGLLATVSGILGSP